MPRVREGGCMPEFAPGSPLWEAVVAAIVLGTAIVVAVLVHPLLTRVAQGLARRTTTTLDDVLVQAVARPLVLLILVQGVFLALTITSYLDPWQAYIQRAWLTAVLVVLFYGLQRVASALIRWYGQEVAGRTGSRLDEKLLPLVRRFVTALIYGLGALLILDNLGIKISPLLAGLGLGGIAVALAVQPTLSNLIAGAFVVADGSIGAGDFIELQGGPMGDVVEIGWRSTKIQTPQGNLVIIPNGKLVDSIVTNYQSPTPEVNVFVNCGVAYESDLERVEVVCVEVAKEVMRELPEAVVAKEFEPVVRFREFGESNINFFVLLRGKGRLDAMKVQHEFMKRLQARFAREGIEINYPVRKLVYPLQDGQRTPRP
ncbi:MAG: mechanosensitive ion channel family protein [Dehalococcoidia bacterium]|nr:mechanosensitive ion channel family protein [Dehalococcoidia bacterium]